MEPEEMSGSFQSSGTERPPLDVFKAIFQDSDSDSSSDEEEGNDTKGKMDVDQNIPEKGEGGW